VRGQGVSLPPYPVHEICFDMRFLWMWAAEQGLSLLFATRHTGSKMTRLRPMWRCPTCRANAASCCRERPCRMISRSSFLWSTSRTLVSLSLSLSLSVCVCVCVCVYSRPGLCSCLIVLVPRAPCTLLHLLSVEGYWMRDYLCDHVLAGRGIG
jgi:hypothetical protein